MTNLKSAILTGLLIGLGTGSASAASGEMGTGTPQFGIYSEVLGVHIRVWSLSNSTVNFPAGCSALVLTQGTLGADTYKAAIATLTAAKAAGMRVRFYAHAERDGGCGIDYFELQQ